MIEINCHSSIKIIKGKTIYIDPFRIEKEQNDASLILITHNHYDHYSEEDIKKVINENTVIVAPKTMKVGINAKEVIYVEPNKQYEILGIKIKSIPAYNINKHFHPKENQWVGYILELEDKKYYVAGDTDITPENKQVKCDIALVPVGGTYTMTYEESAELVNTIKPRLAIPTHYGCIVGNKNDGIKFKELLNAEINCEILIK